MEQVRATQREASAELFDPSAIPSLPVELDMLRGSQGARAADRGAQETEDESDAYAAQDLSELVSQCFIAGDPSGPQPALPSQAIPGPQPTPAPHAIDIPANTSSASPKTDIKQARDIFAQTLEGLSRLDTSGVLRDLHASLSSLVASLDRAIVLEGDGTVTPTKSKTPEEEQREKDQSLLANIFTSSSTSLLRANLYDLLERHIKAIQPPPEDARVIDAVREVEEAEKTVVWGRINDLSQAVLEICQRRISQVSQTSHVSTASHAYSQRCSTSSSIATNLPDYHRVVLQSPGTQRPPSYKADPDHLYGNYANEKVSVDLGGEKNSGERYSGGLRDGTHALSNSEKHLYTLEKETHDHAADMESLDTLLSAIERLYRVSPQLASQRFVHQSPEQKLAIRESQLNHLGNAIERLSRGRLNNQRAQPSPSVLQAASLAQKQLQLQRQHMQQQQQQQHQKLSYNSCNPQDKAALDLIIKKIDEAASRTLTDQRAELSSYRSRPRPLSDITEERSTRPGSHMTMSEFLDTPPRSVGPASRRSSIEDDPTFLVGDHTTLSPTPKKHVASDSSLKKKISSMNILFGSSKLATAPSEGSPPPSRSVERDTSGKAKKTTDVSRNRPSDERFAYCVEQAVHLNTLVVSVWSLSSVLISVKAIAVANDTCHVTTRRGETITIMLPCAVAPQSVQEHSISPHGALSFKLVALHASQPSTPVLPSIIPGKVPLSASELSKFRPSTFCCSFCDTPLVSRVPERFSNLPSPFWTELMDAWMCHPDHSMSADILAKGKQMHARPQETLVGIDSIVFDASLVSVHVPGSSKGTESDNNTVLYDAYCPTCANLIGKREEGKVFVNVHLFKYTTYPVRDSEPLRYSLGFFISCHLLDIQQAHACHRFVLCEPNATERLAIWIFNPHVRLTYDRGRLPVAMNAIKLFYAIPANGEAVFTDGQVPVEKIIYPNIVIAAVIEKLKSSTFVYAKENQTWNSFSVGFLERL